MGQRAPGQLAARAAADERIGRGRAACAKAGRLVDTLLATRDADGYLGIYDRTSRYAHPPGENDELWSRSGGLPVLLTQHELTGDARYLGAAVRLVDGLLPCGDGYRTTTVDRMCCWIRGCRCGGTPPTPPSTSARSGSPRGPPGRDDLHRVVLAALAKLSAVTVPSGAVIGDESIHGLAGPTAD